MKILMTAMTMDLGGAETHILELSLELTSRGHDVTVASNGGVYADKLILGGVKHIHAPLHSKKPHDVAKSIKILSQLMQKERFDIVHAHARIPAFICGRLQKKFGFIFITTAHGDFKAGPFLSRMTDWGDHILAVSRDIAENLSKKYSYPEENITLINNGIDTSRFSPENDGTMIRNQFGLCGKKVVMYLGRLNDDSALVAKMLLESAPSLYRKNKDIRVMIVGEGKNLIAMRKRALEINSCVGKEIVLLPGGTPKAAEYIAACDIFVAPSRSAMEAAASGKPTVIAGRYGMLGIFSPDIEEDAMRTNFCCRGSEPPTSEKIEKCVMELLQSDEEKLKSLTKYGRNFIETHYSVRTMTDTCEKLYRDMLKKKKTNVVICGYYGYGNAGDEAMLASLISSLSENENIGNICVMSAAPHNTRQKYVVDSVHRFNFVKVMRALSASDAMIFGGGNILQDKTSTKSLLYYLQIMNLARKSACKVVLCANGIGPLKHKRNIERVGKELALADYISIRDEASLAFVREITGRDDIYGTSDLVCAAKETKENAPSFVRKGKYYLVFPKKIKGSSTGKLALLCAEINRKYGLFPVFIPMHGREDSKLCKKLAARTNGIYFSAEDDISPLVERAEFSICMRLHAAIFSLMKKCPMIGISDDGKISAFLGSLGISGCAFFPPGAQNKDISDALRKTMANRANIRKNLAFEASQQHQRAEKELERLSQFLEKNV